MKITPKDLKKNKKIIVINKKPNDDVNPTVKLGEQARVGHVTDTKDSKTPQKHQQVLNPKEE